MSTVELFGEAAFNTPRIKSVEIENVRGFKKLSLKFSPGVNIVSTLARGSGKTTLLSLLSGSIQDGIMQYGDNVRNGAKKGRLSIAYEPFNYTFSQSEIPLGYGLLMLNDFKQLKTFAREIPADRCFLLELDWLRHLKVPCKDVLGALSKARCQVIATTMEYPLREIKLPKGTKQIKI